MRLLGNVTGNPVFRSISLKESLVYDLSDYVYYFIHCYIILFYYNNTVFIPVDGNADSLLVVKIILHCWGMPCLTS